MLRNPKDFRQIVILSFIFLIGLAMICIPLVRQHQEIDAGNSIYAMLAEEIRHQQAAQTEADPPDETDAVPESPSIEEPEGETDSDLPTNEEPEEEPTDESLLPAIVLVDAPSDPPTINLPADIPENDMAVEDQSSEPSLEPAITKAPGSTQKPSAQETQESLPENKDYVAWISIPGTVIDYPVVRSDRTEYYLHHLINGQKSKLGCLFSLTTSDYETPSQNIAIYGHHLSNSTAMFSTLMNYKKEAYWKSHQAIQLDTLYGKRTYRIFAVLNHTVSDWDASTATFKDGASFLKFVNRAKKKAFYDTGITVSESDHIITLITCDRSYGGVQGRLLVMGVEQ